jgi:hypothetical protein
VGTSRIRLLCLRTKGDNVSRGKIIGMEPLMAPRFRAGLALVQLLSANATRPLLDKISGEANSRELFDEAQKVRNAMFGGGR